MAPFLYRGLPWLHRSCTSTTLDKVIIVIIIPAAKGFVKGKDAKNLTKSEQKF
jgi:hypothetical protein